VNHQEQHVVLFNHFKDKESENQKSLVNSHTIIKLNCDKLVLLGHKHLENHAPLR
jgi:hypothetical protein